MVEEIGNKVLCFYCTEYSRIYLDYPINQGTFNEFNDLTPRCELHFQYQCDTCQSSIHFNGISYCSECDKFSCVRCTTERLVMKDFFYYDCYYEIPCHSCRNEIPTLDFAEHQLLHPFQIGKRYPATPIALWVPSSQPDSALEGSKTGWGSKRIIKLANINEYVPVENANSGDAKEVWNDNADMWKEEFGKEGDYHHKYLIIPNMLELIDLGNDVKELEIFDLGCGFGLLTRILAKKGCKVTGLDVAEKMLNYAIKDENKSPLGIRYILGDALKTRELISPQSQDMVVSNMAIMDMPEYKSVFQQVFEILKPSGVFVFSIAHPVLAWPSTYTLKLPRDSEKNEDKIWVVDDYFNSQPIKIEIPKLGLLTFRRTVSEYINSLINTGFVIDEVREPQASDELAERLPRNAFRDDQRKPETMMFKVHKP